MQGPFISRKKRSECPIAVEAIDKAVTEVAKFDAGGSLSVVRGTMLTALQMTGSSLP